MSSGNIPISGKLKPYNDYKIADASDIEVDVSNFIGILAGIDNDDWTDPISNVHIEVKYYFIPEEANG